MTNVTLRETGKYLKPLMLDLAHPSPWVKLAAIHKGTDFPGMYYQPTDVPGGPRLLKFPAPYHPIEWLMLDRGAYNDRVIEKCRLSLDPLIEHAGRVLYWPRTVGLVMFHLFTPFGANGGPAEDLIVRIRARMWKQLGLGVCPPRGWGVAYDYTKFWGQRVWGEIEL